MGTSAQSYRHLFGPVPSRRFGRSLGVDLNPYKVCTENCVFCQVGSTTDLTTVRKEWVDTGAVMDELTRWRDVGGQADFISLAGAGEPTLHSRFGDILRHAKALGPFQTALLSNGSLMWDAAVRRDAAAADIVKVTCSAWDEESFRRLHRPADGVTFVKLVEGIRALRQEYSGRLWVEVMLLPGYNDQDEQIRKIAAILQPMGADAIHLNTSLRPVGTGMEIPPLAADRLAAVAPWFTPVAELPSMGHSAQSPLVMSDAELIDLLLRHPLTLHEWAEAADVNAAALRQRLQPLVDDGRLILEDTSGGLLIRAAQA